MIIIFIFGKIEQGKIYLANLRVIQDSFALEIDTEHEGAVMLSNPSSKSSALEELKERGFIPLDDLEISEKRKIEIVQKRTMRIRAVRRPSCL